MPATPARWVIYCRVSKDVLGEGLAVQRQEQLCRERGLALGWGEPTYVYIDNSISASKKVKRPAYQQMLIDIEAGRVDAVMVYDLDRLHRQPIELEHFIDVADQHRLMLASIAGDADLSTDNGRLFARIKGAVARSEVERKSARSKAANKQAALAGQYAQRTRPFGWNRDDSLNVAEAELIRAGYDELLSGGSIRGLVKSWNEQGIVTSLGRQWNHTSMRKLFLRARNAGLSVYDGEVVGKGSWDAIVDEATYHSVVSLLNDPNRVTHTSGLARKHLLSYLMVCGCGGDIVGGSKNNHGVPVYRCRTCARGVHQDIADEVVTNWVAERLSQPSNLKALRKLTVQSDLDRIAEIRTELASITADEETLSAAPIGLALKIAEGQKLQARRETLQDQLTVLEQSNALVKLLLGLCPPLQSVPGVHAYTVGDLREEAYRTIERFSGLSLDHKRLVIASLATVTLMAGQQGNKDLIKSAQRVQIESRVGYLAGGALLVTRSALRERAYTGSGKSKAELKAVRAWANGNGYQVATNGRVPKDILRAYDVANQH